MVNLETFVNFICPQLMLTSSLLQPKRLPFLKRYILAFTERNAQISYIYYLKTILACSGSSLYHIAPRRALPCQRSQSADAGRPTAEKSSSRARPKIFPNILIVSTLYIVQYKVLCCVSFSPDNWRYHQKKYGKAVFKLLSSHDVLRIYLLLNSSFFTPGEAHKHEAWPIFHVIKYLSPMDLL